MRKKRAAIRPEAVKIRMFLLEMNILRDVGIEVNPCTVIHFVYNVVSHENWSHFYLGLEEIGIL